MQSSKLLYIVSIINLVRLPRIFNCWAQGFIIAWSSVNALFWLNLCLQSWLWCVLNFSHHHGKFLNFSLVSFCLYILNLLLGKYKFRIISSQRTGLVFSSSNLFSFLIILFISEPILILISCILDNYLIDTPAYHFPSLYF